MKNKQKEWHPATEPLDLWGKIQHFCLGLSVPMLYINYTIEKQIFEYSKICNLRRV
jgi:hypothetical protein